MVEAENTEKLKRLETMKKISDSKSSSKSVLFMLLISLTISQLMYLLLITIVVPYGRTNYPSLGAVHYGVIGSMQ